MDVEKEGGEQAGEKNEERRGLGRNLRLWRRWRECGGESVEVKRGRSGERREELNPVRPV